MFSLGTERLYAFQGTIHFIPRQAKGHQIKKFWFMKPAAETVDQEGNDMDPRRQAIKLLTCFSLKSSGLRSPGGCDNVIP